jgi:hypothetical protein
MKRSWKLFILVLVLTFSIPIGSASANIKYAYSTGNSLFINGEYNTSYTYYVYANGNYLGSVSTTTGYASFQFTGYACGNYDFFIDAEYAPGQSAGSLFIYNQYACI